MILTKNFVINKNKYYYNFLAKKRSKFIFI